MPVNVPSLSTAPPEILVVPVTTPVALFVNVPAILLRLATIPALETVPAFVIAPTLVAAPVIVVVPVNWLAIIPAVPAVTFSAPKLLMILPTINAPALVTVEPALLVNCCTAPFKVPPAATETPTAAVLELTKKSAMVNVAPASTTTVPVPLLFIVPAPPVLATTVPPSMFRVPVFSMFSSPALSVSAVKKPPAA